MMILLVSPSCRIDGDGDIYDDGVDDDCRWCWWLLMILLLSPSCGIFFLSEDSCGREKQQSQLKLHL